MKYYYTLDSNNYIVNWSVGASFSGATELPSSVVVPDDLKTCSCDAKCYKLEDGVFTFDTAKAAQCETECEEDNAKYCPATKQEIPKKISDLQNDSGYITGYTETDPTVPDWAKQATKPSYTPAEVGAMSASAVVTAFWKGTQSEYEALGTYDSTTLYLIEEG